jgi:Ca-activated chloride channel homolog
MGTSLRAVLRFTLLTSVLLLLTLLTSSSALHAAGPGSLDWLAAHQAADGSFAGGPEVSQRSATAYTLLAFFGAGETHKHGRYKDQVRSGLKWLKLSQMPDGSFAPAGNPRFVRDHALCTLAMVEAYSLTGSPLFKKSAELGLARLALLRTPPAGWGPEGPTSRPDLPTTIFAEMAFKTARGAGLSSPPGLETELIAFVDALTDTPSGMNAPRSGEKPEVRATAMAILLRVLCGADPGKDQAIIDATRALLKHPPVWDEEHEGAIDPLTWYFGTQALFLVGGEPWKTWNMAMKPAINDSIRTTGENQGSWDPVGAFGQGAGRTVVTALLTMCQTVYYRYARVFGTAGGGGPAGSWGGEEYDQVAGNRFDDPLKHPLSTFSIDVDTASYANVRRILTAGNVPPAGAVRVEEMINYFTYDYPEPKDGEPFSVTTEIASCPWSPGHRLLHIGLKARSLPETDLPPRNLVFLLDVSGSMGSTDKLPLVVRAMRLLAESLTGQDRVAIVVYAGESRVVLDPTTGDQRRTIEAALAGLTAGGSTNGEGGIQMAYELATRHFEKQAINRVILATDGDFNVGIADRGSLVTFIEEKRESGIYLSVLGVGSGNLKDSSMEALADHGNGNYSYLDTLDEARKVLVREAGGTLITIARDVKIQVEFNPLRVGSYRLIGYENRLLEEEDFDDDEKDAGEIGAGHTVTALYEIIPPEDVAAAETDSDLKYQDPRRLAGAAFGDEIANVKLRFKEPDGEKSRLRTVPVIDSGQESTAAASESFRFSAAVAGFGLLVSGSEHRGEVTAAMVRELAHSALGEDPHSDRRGFLELLQLWIETQEE